MSSSASPAAPRATAQQAQDLRRDLQASGWGVDAVEHLLGTVAHAALQREIRMPAIQAIRGVLDEDRRAGAHPTPAAVLTALFMLGQSVSEAELDAALRRTRTAGALAMGLVAYVDEQPLDERPGSIEPLNEQALDEQAGNPQAAGSEQPLGEQSTDHATPPSPLEGEVKPNQTRMVRALVDLRPHEVAGANTGSALSHDDSQIQPEPGQRWWVASDLGELVTGRALEADHVLGIGGAGLTLASLTPRHRVAAALDLGCGCGIQTLYLLLHAQHVVATDISQRALAFTAFNAALAGIEDDRLTLKQGSFLQPVAGERFDLVATNPPFVLTPPAVREAGLPLMEYRDAGEPVLPTLVPALADHLTVGGIAVMLGNWEHLRDIEWTVPLTSWLPQDCDAWIIQRETQDPVEYATMWLRDGGATPERDPQGFDAALGAWIDDFSQRDVESIGFGYIMLHRPDPQHDGGVREVWRCLEEVTTTPALPLGAHIARSIEVRSGLAAMSDDDVANLHPVLAGDVTEERYLRPGETEPSVILLRQGGGFGRCLTADTALAALVSVADGELSVAQIASAVATLLDVPASELRAQMVADTRRLAVNGFFEL